MVEDISGCGEVTLFTRMQSAEHDMHEPHQPPLTTEASILAQYTDQFFFGVIFILQTL